MTGALILLALAAFTGWRISLHLHPNRTCTACDGKGESFGRIFTGTRGPCRHCDGRGQVPRRPGRRRSPLR